MDLGDFPNLLQCDIRQGSEVATLEELSELESLIGVRLPEDYRVFIQTVGRCYLDGWAPCTYPTPFGSHGITHIYAIREVIHLLGSAIVPPNMICIGAGDFGAFSCLSIAGLDHGHVYSLDSEMNYFKTLDGPQQFYKGSPQAAEFYRLKAADELPPRPWGYENCYHVADTFRAYLLKLQSLDTQL